ncbi:hypothetical protein CGRA01v4_01666 [Colletotrichum graminicola]|nr:hypothetical protein CGRA01v4_01666 [Colletotrichum graminicola]
MRMEGWFLQGAFVMQLNFLLRAKPFSQRFCCPLDATLVYREGEE